MATFTKLGNIQKYFVQSNLCTTTTLKTQEGTVVQSGQYSGVAHKKNNDNFDGPGIRVLIVFKLFVGEGGH
jgi:hypothetical protein